MLKHFRKLGKEKAPLAQPSPPERDDLKQPKPTFFDLPAEIRNTIYELVAQDTYLHIILDAKQSKQNLNKIPSLLIASKQCRHEYPSILLSTAIVQATIIDFNFSPLLSRLQNLDPTSTKSLLPNPNLTIRLRLKKCGSDVYSNLRQWCEQPSEAVGKWRYELYDQSGTNVMHLAWFSARTRVLRDRIEDEKAKQEAGRILEVLGDALRDVQLFGGGFGQGFGDAFVEIAARRRI